MIKKYIVVLLVFALASCSDANVYTKNESPSNAFKDYKGHDKTVVGIGATISKRKAKADATISYKGNYSLGDAIGKFSRRYDLSVEWDGNTDRFVTGRLTASKQSFNEARTYLEEVFDISIVRVRDRAIKIVLPSTVKKIELFNPGPNVRLAEAVNGLASLCDINLVIADYKDVLAQEKITTNLDNMACTQAFEAILSPFGLSLKNRGSHYTIAGLPYKEWSLQLHEQKREESQNVNYSTEFSGSSSEGETSSGGFISGGGSKTEVSYKRDVWDSLDSDLKKLIEESCKNSQSMGYEPLERKAISQNFNGMDIAAGDQTTIVATENINYGNNEQKREARKRPCGYVTVNRDVGLVGMQAPKRVLEKADDIINKLEEIASRRLLVEARILAVAKTRSYDRGTDFTLMDNIKGTKAAIGFSSDTALRDGTDSVTSAVNNLLNGAAGSAVAGGALALHSSSLDAVVRFVQSFGTTYQLMKPTLEIMDRQKSTLIDGRNEKYFVRNATLDTSGDIPLVTTEAKERVQFIGIQFSVSAQIAEDEGGLHTVALQIPITEISGYVTLENQAGTFTMKDIIPIATTRVIDQKVRIRDDEIKVIGGLTRTIAVDKETGVPLLKEVPVAGDAFSEESVTYEEAEFIVLLQVKKLD
ncbi:MAG: hypothetical protein GY793_09420 [Proteobacteria bacterium]|nr:hypothetical protein [Pseudomonadota bacterium]